MDSDPGEGTSDGRIKRNRKRKPKRKFKSNVPELTIKEEIVIKSEPIEHDQLDEYSRKPNIDDAVNISMSESESESDNQSNFECDVDCVKKEIKSECDKEKPKNEDDDQVAGCGNTPQISPNNKDKKRKPIAKANGRNRILTQKKQMTNRSKKSQAKQPKLHKCHSCDYTTSHKGHLNVHIRTHTGQKPFECEICSKSFTRKNTLNGHKNTHLPRLQFRCWKCRMGFAHKIEKNNHQDKCQHRQYECYLCQYSTVFLTHLKQHMRSKHTGQKPFECSVCTKPFTQKPHLDGHLRTHVKQLPFECTKCGTRFIDEDQKQSHEKRCMRRKYECYMCSYKCFTKCQLKKHMRKHHTGEKPFRCEVCQKRFIWRESLKIHLASHIKRQPIRCSKCLRRFKDDNDKAVHEKCCGRRHFECFLCKIKVQRLDGLKSHMKKHHI